MVKQSSILMVVAWVIFIASAAAAAPISLPYSGRFVEDNAKPVEGPVDIIVEFFSAETGGESVSGPHVFTAVTLEDGVFQLNIALEASEFHKIFKNVDRPAWIQITEATHGVVYPRQLLAATPYALKVPVDNSTIGWNNDGQLTVLDGRTLTEKNGNLGIGAANPATKIEIESTSAATGATDGLLIDQQGAGDSAISFKTPAKQFVVGIDQSDANKFKISDGSDFGADRFVIDSAGKVGIGTTSPTSRMDLRADGSGRNLVLSTDGTQNAHIHFQDGTVDEWHILRREPDNSFRIVETGVNDVMTFLPGGNVGIGTTTPSTTLHVAGPLPLRIEDTNGGTAARFDSSGAGYGYVDFNRSGTRYGILQWSDTYIGLRGDNGASIWLDGVVGIGTTTPEATLHVATNDAKILDLRTGTADHGYISFYTDAAAQTSRTAYIGYPSAGSEILTINNQITSGDIGLYTGAAGGPKLFVKSDGNVGIGTSNPGQKLDVFDGYVRSSNYGPAAGSAAGMYLYRSQGGAPGSEVAPSSGVGLGFLSIGGYRGDATLGTGSVIQGTTDTAWTPNSTAAHLDFYTTADSSTSVVRRMRIHSNGNVGIGTTTPDESLTVSGDIKILSASRLHFSNTSDLTHISAPVSNTLAFATSGAEAVRINSAGNVGVGTSNPSSSGGLNGVLSGDLILDVAKTGWGVNDDVQVRVGDILLSSRNTGLSEISTSSARGSNGNMKLGAEGSMFLQSGGDNNRITILNTGNVGIGGTATPQSALQVIGYAQLDLTSGAPPVGDCDAAAERGRMKVDNAAGLLYICMNSGWVSK